MGHELDPRNPVHIIPFTLAASESRDFDVSGARVLYLLASTSLGTGAGDVSIALGETGSFFDWAPADGLILSQFGRVRLRNNTAVVKSGVIAYSADEKFRVLNAPRGL